MKHNGEGGAWKGSRIAWKLAACFALVLVVFSLLAGSVFLALFHSHTVRINRLKLENEARSIAETLAGFQVESGGRHRMMGAGYLQFLDDLAMADVWIVDRALNLMTCGHGHHGQLEYGDLPVGAEQIVERVFQGEMTYSEEFSPLLNTPTLTVGAPISYGGEVVGAVLVHSPVSGIEEAVSQGVLAMVAGMVTALVVAVAVSALLSYSFTKPLHKMKNAALKLADGDYSAKTGVSQNDEIGQLAHTLDDLAGRLAEASREREALEKMREDFVANVSHELRTPVTVLRGSLEVLQDGTVEDPGEIREYHAQMLAESLHMERLVNDLLDLSRLQNADFKLEIQPLDLCGVVTDVARSMRRAAGEKRVVITADCPAEECLVLGDYNRLRQMLMITVDNAVKFSPEGGAVEIRLTQDPMVTVTDHGCGVKPQDLRYIFDRFHKETSARNQNGTGLGLAIAKQIADRHGVEITVKSVPGETVFGFRFPGSEN